MTELALALGRMLDVCHARTLPDESTGPVQEFPPLQARVLIAEDNPLNQELMLDLMESWGCQTDIAGDGYEAVRTFMSGSYDIVLMDCQMPELDGFAATDQIRHFERQSQTSKPVPIIALTANAMQGDRDRCIQAGMDDFVSKPFQHDQLRQVITRWIEKSQGTAG